MRSVTFASSNDSKSREVEEILAQYGIPVRISKLQLTEIQSDSLEEIAKEKSRNAYSIVLSPVIVEDDGLFVDALGGFPGPYSSFVFKTIGNQGILRLLAGIENRSAHFHAVIAHFDGDEISLYSGQVLGEISDEISSGGWGYDPIFKPSGCDLTFGQLKEDKSKYSHRRKALELFAQKMLAQSADK